MPIGLVSRLVTFLFQGIQHPHIRCNECPRSEVRIVGTRWKCMECYDFDLCTNCYMNDKHNTSHRFIRFDKERTNGLVLFDVRNILGQVSGLCLLKKFYIHAGSVHKRCLTVWFLQAKQLLPLSIKFTICSCNSVYQSPGARFCFQEPVKTMLFLQYITKYAICLNQQRWNKIGFHQYQQTNFNIGAQLVRSSTQAKHLLSSFFRGVGRIARKSTWIERSICKTLESQVRQRLRQWQDRNIVHSFMKRQGNPVLNSMRIRL